VCASVCVLCVLIRYQVYLIVSGWPKFFETSHFVDMDIERAFDLLVLGT
jgi:hypothetical protein